VLPQVVRGSSGGASFIPTCNPKCGCALPIPPRRSQKSRRKRSCSDYAKFEPDWSVDKRGGTLRCNKNTWITSVRLGSNQFRTQDINRREAEACGPAAEAQGVAAATRSCFARRRGWLAKKPRGGRNDLRSGYWVSLKKDHPSGSKALLIFGVFTARLKSCPFATDSD